jgi:hypothetical protein
VKLTIGWILAIVFGMILILLLPGLWMISWLWTGGYGSMMGGPGMMGGYNTMHPFGWGGMVLGWLIQVGLIILLVIGAVALVNGLNRTGNPILVSAVPSQNCPNCAKPAQVDWNSCPYCGQKFS